MITRAHFVFAVMALALGACSSATEPIRLAGPPDEFRFELGGFGVDGRTVELRNDTLLFYRRPFASLPGTPIDTVRVVPTAEAWRTFWTTAELTGVHRWQGRYNAEGVVDGSGWSLRIVEGSRRVESNGSNAYPDRSGKEHELDMTSDFRAFVSALSALVGAQVGF
jgi:hypothetical protein